jgi:hypothetical protein
MCYCIRAWKQHGERICTDATEEVDAAGLRLRSRATHLSNAASETYFVCFCLFLPTD